MANSSGVEDAAWEMANSSGVEDAAWGRAIEVITMHCVPMALQAALKLNVLEILAAAGKQELSASEIVARMKPSISISISDPDPLDRILRVLASHGVLSSSLHEQQLQLQPQPHGQLPVRKYGITAVSRYFVGDASLGALNTMAQLKPFTDAWPLLDQCVLQGTAAFDLAHHKPPYLFAQTDPHFRNSFNAGMSNFSKLFMPFFLRSYHGFHHVHTLVDVGGGIGTCLSAILSHYPHIKGINFDLPHVVASSPSYPGMENVGGDMFKSIPQADAIFMKNILHNYSDESCVEILKTCYKALPKNGKVIVVDIILSPSVETTTIACVQSRFDLAMLAFFMEGKERTQQNLQVIANAAGFKRFHFITEIYDTSVVELQKD